MTLDNWQGVGEAVGAVAFGAFIAWQTLLARKSADGAKKSADQANHNVTVNGSKDPANPTMPDRLSKLEKAIVARLDSQDAKLDAQSQDLREVRAAQGKTHELMTEHLADHAGSDLSRPH